MLNLDSAPTEPLERLLWLTGAAERAKAEIDAAWQEAYFTARAEGKLPEALALGLHSRKRVLRFTRNENEARGRVIARWGDGLSS